MDHSNDVLLGNNPVQVVLTPPPNLRVEKIVIPSPSFSGTIVIGTRGVLCEVLGDCVRP